MRLLIASDGSAAARAAVGVALAFPWPPRSRVRGVVALGRTGFTTAARTVRALHARAEDLRQALGARWRAATVFELHDRPAEAIVAEARRFRADVIVVGWRGHGAIARLVAGSVSHAVAERARCPVLVVRAAAHGAATRFVIGFDGSPNARQAVRFLARLAVPRGGRAVLVSVLQVLSSDASRMLAQQQAAARALRARGWQVAATTASGAPVDALLRAARRERAHVMVVGAAGHAGLERLVLGSVAQGVLGDSPLPVLVVRAA